MARSGGGGGEILAFLAGAVAAVRTSRYIGDLLMPSPPPPWLRREWVLAFWRGVVVFFCRGMFARGRAESREFIGNGWRVVAKQWMVITN